MSTPYPWIKDSQYGTTPLVTGYLEVTSTNGLYLNSTTSGTNSNAILMTGFITGGSTPVTCYYYCDKLRYYPNVWGGETFLSQDMLRFINATGDTLSQLNLSGLTCFNPGVNTYFQSSNNGQYQSIGSSGEQIYISSNGGSGNVYFSAANLYLNGTPIGGGGGVTDIQAGSGISVNQNTGSVTITNTGGGGGGVTDIQAGPGISVNQTTGSVTITNTGGSIPQTAYAMPFQSGYTPNNSQTIFSSSGVYITGGYSYSVVWTFWYDGLYQSGGGQEMIQGYADLYSNSTGSIKGSANQSGYWASTTISSNNMYRTTITYTDNYYISSSDTYVPNVLQLNTANWDGNTYVSAVITRTS